jgi:hypothetical protein
MANFAINAVAEKRSAIMNKYEIIKGLGRTAWHVRADEDVMRFYSKRECEAWIARAIRRDLVIAAEKIERRENRLERVMAYLAARTLRVPAPTQLELL